MEAPIEGKGTGVGLLSRITHGIGSVADAGAGASRDLLEMAGAVQRTSLAVAQESVRTVPLSLIHI